MKKFDINLSCEPFVRNLKKLAHKFPKVKCDLNQTLDKLEMGVPLGTPIPFLNQPVYKVRIRNSQINKGKSSGYRLIYKFDEPNRRITPLLIYFKADKANVQNKDILDALKSLD